MKTVDHKKFPLRKWIYLDIGVQDIWKKNRCFVAFQLVLINETGFVEYFNVILNFPWLYSVDVFNFIQKSIITVGNINAGEIPRNVVGFEMVFLRKP